ncbi:MAG: transthyretin-like family protein [Endomicrobia bacterium]|nr:transthyretin-like family protein [Endomicrobiia bacterium]
MVKILSSIIVCLPIANMCLLPWFWHQIWFLGVTTLLTISTGLYRFLFSNIEKKLVVNSKILVSVIFFISICNLLVLILGYTTKFISVYLKTKSSSETDLLVSTSTIVMRGKIFILENLFFKLPAANAKLILVDKKSNKVLDIIYTDINGNFFYERKNIENHDCILKVEHIDCKNYQTEVQLYPPTIKELEIYLQKKTTPGGRYLWH